MNSLSDVWKTVLDRLKQQLSDTTINTWFDEVTVVTMEDSALVLHCGNTFKKKHHRKAVHAADQRGAAGYLLL